MSAHQCGHSLNPEKELIEKIREVISSFPFSTFYVERYYYGDLDIFINIDRDIVVNINTYPDSSGDKILIKEILIMFLRDDELLNIKIDAIVSYLQLNNIKTKIDLSLISIDLNKEVNEILNVLEKVMEAITSLYLI